MGCKENRPNRQCRENNGHDLCPGLGMSQPDDCKRSSESAHQQGIGIAALILIANPSGNCESGNDCQYGHHSSGNDCPPVLPGPEVKGEKWQGNGQEKDGSKICCRIAATGSHGRRNAQYTQDVRNQQCPGARMIVQIDDQETQPDKKEE